MLTSKKITKLIMWHSVIRWSQTSCTTLKAFHSKHCVTVTDAFFIVRHLESIYFTFIKLGNRAKLFILYSLEKSRYYRRTSAHIKQKLPTFYFTYSVFLIERNVDNIQLVDMALKFLNKAFAMGHKKQWSFSFSCCFPSC